MVAAKRDTAPVLEGLRMEDLMVWLDAKQLAVPNVPMIQKKPAARPYYRHTWMKGRLTWRPKA